ncbi:MAG: hypothetical protein D9V47_05095 [Clostridia bacterium]|nr:MAG: hypothetical protein D9V47_05095 [Clostridia bacterium]
MDTTHVEAEATAPPKDKKDDPAYQHTDDNVGVLRKSNTVTYIAHKVALVVDANEDFCYTHCTFKGNTSDPETLEGTLLKFKEEFPEVAKEVEIVLADGIYQSANNQKVSKEVLEAKLYAPINPRNRKSVKLENVRGITEIDPYGRPKCLSGRCLDLVGRDQKQQQYIWGCPVFGIRHQETLDCPEANHLQCCNLNAGGRYYRTNRTDFPQIDWENPQHSVRFGLHYNREVPLNG